MAAIEAIATEVVTAVEVKRAAWIHRNLMAEASQQTMDLRFATTSDREAVVAMVVDAAQCQSVSLTPPEVASSPVRFQREDGTSLFRPRHSAKYSSIAIIEAEVRLLNARRTVCAWAALSPPSENRVIATVAAKTAGATLAVQVRLVVDHPQSQHASVTSTRPAATVTEIAHANPSYRFAQHGMQALSRLRAFMPLLG